MAAAAAAATAKAAEQILVLDEETLALMGSHVAVAPGAELEASKENVRPLKRGRDVALLNRALKAHANPAQRAALLAERRSMIEAIEEYRGEDPLQPWLDCIKWVQESFPSGGECSGLVVMYEQCVRAFWHDERYKDDLRYLKVWLEYAGNCADTEVIFRFLEANQIGQGHAIYYMSYAALMESKNKLRKANEIFNIGIERKAKPVEKLEAVYRTFLRKTTKRREHSEDDTSNDDQPVRSFGSDLNRGRNAENSHLGKPRALQRIDANRLLSVYKDEKSLPNQGLDRIRSKENNTSWRTLGTQADRNKENNMMPAKWTSHKVPQKLGARATVQSTRASSIEVFVDDECAQELARQVPKSPNPSVLKLRQATSKNLKKETELLKENPLRNFPLSSLR
ncbi:mitotic spindle checkpoint protein BUBR1-like isoform X2 [Phragmites australis]|uniref:mitotic spindle checkpoint protein BUBR1-like isoform X2 n=1 Tax=Phragmites australis TaxID=29695 RepID=UPI002D77B4FC|nr:mitotic spindle checkpoint protein BUBR1-like isoform X2 [Phragmites australis]